MKSVLICALVAASILSAEGWRQHAAADPKAASRANPYAGNAEAAAAGAKLYERYCSACHGRDAQGYDRYPPLRPAAQTTSAGELEWLLRNGSLKKGMPSWSQLPPQQRWQLITYLKSLSTE